MPRWQIRPSSRTACSAERSVTARCFLRPSVVRGVVDSMRPASPSAVASENVHFSYTWEVHSTSGRLPVTHADIALPVSLDRSAVTPLAVQLADALREAAATGHLRGGDRLPSTRALAGRLG